MYRQPMAGGGNQMPWMKQARSRACVLICCARRAVCSATTQPCALHSLVLSLAGHSADCHHGPGTGTC